MKAVILAAGKGTRLLPLTTDIPKTLVEINGKPIIERIISSLPEEISEIVVVVSHLKDAIQNFLGDEYMGKKIYFAEQGEKRGTFGALLSARNLLEGDDRFLVTNGDDIHDRSEFEECLKYPRSMAVERKIMPNYYSTEINESGYFTGFRPQTEIERTNGALVATGVFVIDKNIFDETGVLLSTGEYGLPQTVLLQIEKCPLKVVEISGWLPINSHNDLKKAEEYFSSK